MKNKSIKDLPIDKTWSLFLDRDGVINLHYPNDYVKKWEEFFFLEGVLDALNILAHKFRRILLVTNQQGVGKGVMSKEDLNFIHSEMLKEIRKYGGRLHMIYTATEKLENDKQKMRKPEIGMAKQAKKDFPEIDFERSIIVGDSLTDMQFGRKAGMKTVFIGDMNKLAEKDRYVVDYNFDSLAEFTAAL